MKVLHINSYYGYTMLYKNLYDRQIKKGLDISVYVPLNKNEKKFTKDILGDYCIPEQIFSDFDRAFFTLKEYKIFKAISRQYNFSEISITHAHTLFVNGYLSYKLKKQYKIPYVVAVRNSDLNTFFKYRVYLRKIGIKILLDAEKIICISNPYEKRLLSYIKNEDNKKTIRQKLLTIPNGIDDFWINNIYEKSRIIKNKTITFICIANIEKNKNQLNICKAIQLLEKENYFVKLVLAGTILDRAYYKKISKYPFVEYKGNLNQNQLLQEFRNSDIFIMPSYRETFGLVFAEALTQGLPIIYTKNEGFDGQFPEGEVGYGVLPDDIVEIQETIKKTIVNYEKLAKNCFTKSENYNWNKIASHYDDIYCEVARGKLNE